MKRLKTLLKIIALLVVLVIVAIAIFSAMNWTLVSNMATVDTRRTDNVREWETIVTPVKGNRDDSLLTLAEPSQLSEATVSSLMEYHQQEQGLSLIVWQNGKIQVEHYPDNMDDNAVTASYSMNKSITGLVAATLHADGTLSLDDPVSAVLTEWRDDLRGAMTLRDLLQHSTPLKVVSMAKPDFRTMEILIGDDIEKAALSNPVDDAGLGFEYATINYQVAGAVIRRYVNQTFNQRYAEYLSEKIWQPIGAGDAWLSSGKQNGIPRFYAGMQASARDWLKIGLLIKNNGQLNGKQVIPAEAIAQLTTPANSNSLYGLGVWLGSPADGSREYGPNTAVAVTHSAPYLAHDVIFFDGFGGQRVYIVPSKDLVVVRTGQVSLSYDDSILVNMVLNNAQ